VLVRDEYPMVTGRKIVATGSIGDAFAPPFSFDFVLARYNADGSLDATFDGDGKVSTDLGAWDLADSVVIQTDGKIIAAGSAGTGGNPPVAYDFALARYNPDGSLDSTFDGDGKVLTDSAASIAPSALRSKAVGGSLRPAQRTATSRSLGTSRTAASISRSTATAG
jgi:uncharacterized delta-60 repeat protein